MPWTKRSPADLTARDLIRGGVISAAGTALLFYFAMPALDDTFHATLPRAVTMGLLVTVGSVLSLLAGRSVARRQRVNGSRPDDPTAGL